MEADEAGRLRAFREKFGRGWDAERMDDGEDEEGVEGREGEGEDNLLDLISGFGPPPAEEGTAKAVREGKGKEGKM